MASALKSHYGKVNKTRMSTTNTPKERAGADNGNCKESVYTQAQMCIRSPCWPPAQLLSPGAFP